MAETIIKLENALKRFSGQLIFKDFSYCFNSCNTYAISGINGSGKSTLLKVLAGSLSLNKGKIHWEIAQKKIDASKIYSNIVLMGPYVDLIEEMNLNELLAFHGKFREWLHPDSEGQIKETLGFDAEKAIAQYSSGMKQRLKLMLAFQTKTDILLLDEPTTNLDEQGKRWYLSLIGERDKNALLVVASALAEDHSFCDELIEMGRI